MISQPTVFFGAADRQMELFSSAKEFERSLVHSVLFQGDQLVSDVFFYVSSHMGVAVKEHSRLGKFIEESLRQRAIIPAFRSDCGGSFTDNLAEIQLAGILGLQSDVAEVAKKLEKATRGIRLHYQVWPKTPLSVGFRSLLEGNLLNFNRKFQSETMEKFYRESEPLREAILLTASADSYGGWRRGDLINAVGQYTGIVSSNCKIHDAGEILRAIAGREDGALIQKFLKWVIYCYQYNQGRMLTSSPGLTALDENDLEFILPLGGDKWDTVSLGRGHVASLISIPSPAALLTVEPSELFRIRNGEAGQNYFVALKKWKLRPEAASAEFLQSSLEVYVAQLTATFLKYGKHLANWEWYLHAAIPTSKSSRSASRWDLAIDLGKEAAIELASIPGFGILSLFGRVAAATYEFIPAKAREILSPVFGTNDRVEFDITDGMHRIKNAKAIEDKSDAAFD